MMEVSFAAFLDPVAEWEIGGFQVASADQALRPHIECLEDRCCPSPMVFIVNSAGDDTSGPTPGVVTLRDAIGMVNNDACDSSNTPDVIKFAITGTPTINLGADLPAITNPVLIDGSTQAGVTIDGQASAGANGHQGFAILVVSSAVTVNDVAFTDGSVAFTDGRLTVGAGSILSVVGNLSVGNNTILNNNGSLSVSGNFVDTGSIGIYNAMFSSASATYSATFTVGGSFTAGDDSFVYNNGTATFSVAQGFTLGNDGYVYNGNSSTDAANFSVGGSFAIGDNGYVYNYGASTLGVTGSFTVGGYLYNGVSSTDTATLTVGGSLSVAEYVYNYGKSTLSVTGGFTVGGYLYNGVSPTDAATLTVHGSLSVAEYVYNYGASTLTVDGSFSLVATWYLYNTGTLDIGTLNIDGQFFDYGHTDPPIVTVMSGGVLTVEPGGTFVVQSLDVESGGEVDVSGSLAPLPGGALVAQSLDVESGGEVDVSGTLVSLTPPTGTGQINTEPGGSVSYPAQQATTTTTVTSSANPAVYGQPITFTATVSNTSGTGATPTGTVQFVIDGFNYGSPVMLCGGVATLADSFLTGASHTVEAVYMPTGDFLTSCSTLTQCVQAVAVEPDPSNRALTDLFIGSPGTTSNDQVQVNPIGNSNTGSTGVNVQTQLNGVTTQTNYSQSFSTIYVFLQGGNDNVQLANSLTINAVVTAGNGNDNIHAGNNNTTITLGNGANDQVHVGNGNNVVVEGNGANDQVQAGDGNNNVTVGNGNNDQVHVGNGNNVVVVLSAATTTNDQIQAGNGDNLLVGGLGQEKIQTGNGSNILIDGAAAASTATLDQILSEWMLCGSGAASDIRNKLDAIVTYNTSNANTLQAGNGLDWFWTTYAPDHTNRKATDLLN